jgi:hypothetical protein
LCNGKVGARIAEGGSDFGEGYEDEGALREAGMRNFKAGLRENEIAVQENVEVEGAGAVGDSRGAITAEEAFDEKKGGEKGARRERRVKGDDCIEEARLVWDADGGSGIKGRTRGGASDGREVREGRGERGVWMAGGTGKIGAKADIGEGHAGTRVASWRGVRASRVWRVCGFVATKVGKEKRPRRISTS